MRASAQNIFVTSRHKAAHAGCTWLVDVYDAQLAGIVLAEIGLQSEDQIFETPDWIGQEVTDNPRFHKTRIGHLCREAGRPLSILELLNGGADETILMAV